LLLGPNACATKHDEVRVLLEAIGTCKWVFVAVECVYSVPMGFEGLGRSITPSRLTINQENRGSATCCSHFVANRSGPSFGKRNAKVVPLPSVLSTVSSPPVRRAWSRALQRPTPQLPLPLVDVKGLKMVASRFAGIPGPVSATWIMIESPVSK